MICHQKPINIFNILENKGSPLYLAAPMVRYSKLPFRKLVRKYCVDVAFTPMIISKSFVQSEKCRNVEFTTDNDDCPLIVQFAANNGLDLANAAELISSQASGVDLNCGCPQSWAMSEGYGSFLLNEPDLIADMVRQTKSRISSPDFCISIKIRIDQDLRRTVDLCQKAQSAGVNLLTVHGRTPKQRKESVNKEAIKLIKDSLSIPVIANGDVKSLDDAREIVDFTGVDGVMSARGLLHNPSLFSGTDSTSIECLNDWLDISFDTGASFTHFHHHLMFMLDRMLVKSEKRIFNRLHNVPAVLDFLKEKFQI